MSADPPSRASARRSWLAALIVAAAVALALGGCGGGGSGESTTAGGCSEVDAPAPVKRSAQRPRTDVPTAAGVVFETNCGSFTVDFDQRAPKTAASVQSLVEQGFYDGLPIHRVVGDFLIQGGDPDGVGTGGPGYSIEERPPPSASYTEGTVAMAKTAADPPGSSGSQFFVAVAPDLGLTPDYALLGEVSDGMDTVRSISELAADGEDGPPTSPVVIEKATLKE